MSCINRAWPLCTGLRNWKANTTSGHGKHKSQGQRNAASLVFRNRKERHSYMHGSVYSLYPVVFDYKLENPPGSLGVSLQRYQPMSACLHRTQRQEASEGESDSETKTFAARTFTANQGSGGFPLPSPSYFLLDIFVPRGIKKRR